MLQVLSNLIVNSLDPMAADGTLCLRLRKRRAEAQFLIADNGHGIPTEHMRRNFPAVLYNQGRARYWPGSRYFEEHHRTSNLPSSRIVMERRTRVDDIDGKVGRETEANGGSQTVRLAMDVAERGGGPVDRADELTHLSAVNKPVSVRVLRRGLTARLFTDRGA